MNFSDFSKKFLVALYNDASVSGEVFESGDILDKYGLKFNEGWVDRVLQDWRSREFIQGPGTAGGELVQPLYMTGLGFEQAERLLQKGIVVTERLPEGVVELPQGRVFGSEASPPEGFAGREGDVFYQFEPASESSEGTAVAPAADRVVRFDDNQAARIEISNSLLEIREAVRGVNTADPDERDRVGTSLEAAYTLWQAAQLKIIQVKVGVLMAAEDAANLLKNTAKGVAAALLVDTIKAFIKNYTGVDLDNL